MMNDTFRIQGSSGKKALRGTLRVAGAKNAALKGLVAGLVCEEPVTYHGVPEIADVDKMIELLTGVGASIEKHEGFCVVDASTLTGGIVPLDAARAMRSSVVAIGPLLARVGEVVFPNPGGCDLGERPIDLFLEGLTRMGAEIEEGAESFTLRAPHGLVATDFFFRVQSHTATEMFMMSAVLAKGTTTLRNCALEPEVVHLAQFLNSRGARIVGAGTPTITIEGTGLLAGDAPYETPPDRIETGSFLLLGALCAHELVIENVIPEESAMLITLLGRAGVTIESSVNTLTVRAPEHLMSLHVRTHEYPGLPTDVQAPLAVLLSQAQGESTVFETIFEGRLNYAHELCAAGADIRVEDAHRARISGPRALLGYTYTAPDLRAGFAFVLASLVAKGESLVHNSGVIDRGYERLDERLREVGCAIERI